MIFPNKQMTRKHLQSWLNITPCTFWNCWAAGEVFLLQKSLKLSSHSSNVTCPCPWSQYSFLVWHEKPLLLNRIRYWHTYRWFHLSLPQWEVSLLNLNDWKHNPMYPMPGMPSSGLGTRCIPLQSPLESATYQAASQVAAALDGRDPFSRRQNEEIYAPNKNAMNG